MDLLLSLLSHSNPLIGWFCPTRHSPFDLFSIKFPLHFHFHQLPLTAVVFMLKNVSHTLIFYSGLKTKSQTMSTRPQIKRLNFPQTKTLNNNNNNISYETPPLRTRAEEGPTISPYADPKPSSDSAPKMSDYINMTQLSQRLKALELRMNAIHEAQFLREKLQLGTQEQGPNPPPLLSPNSHAGSPPAIQPEKSSPMKNSIVSPKRNGNELGIHNSLDDEHEYYIDENNEAKRILECWKDFNCGLHLRRIVTSSRTTSACYVLEFLHRRLNLHMLDFIRTTSRGMIGQEKTDFLTQFKRDGPFPNKPLTQGTYAELLEFVCRQPAKPNPSCDLLKALESPEDGLEEDARKQGYDPALIGDIRLQIAVFSRFQKRFSNSFSYSLPLTDKEFSKDLVLDLQRAASQGKIGQLQSCARLVKLGCYLVLRRLAISVDDGD